MTHSDTRTSAARPIAALPMYDWPELFSAHDVYWSTLAESLRAFGFPAPPGLTRTMPEELLWRDEQLLLSQTCGLPLVRDLSPCVEVVGTPAYDIACGAGSYFSVIVVRDDSTADRIDDLSGQRLAYNCRNSQSGYAALAYMLRGKAQSGRSCSAAQFFSESRCTGSHRASIRDVAAGKSDLAAIDAVSWKLALRHEDAARSLRVLATTPPTPGLPMICAKRPDWPSDHIHMAVVEGMAALDTDTMDALLLTGFAQTTLADYAIIARNHAIAKDFTL
ncbi:MAG: PhnD/SsuA/transferrin family substrate-binding protein [Rhizobiaceae bacterium]|nr:PhnD/SsuA/transferrin family substrate-binding protein [Rhizobiaceae bacterium]